MQQVGHRAFECRFVIHNTGRYPQRSQGFFPESSVNRNPNRYSAYDHQLGGGGYQAETSWTATCLICHGSSQTAATCRRKNYRMNNGPCRTLGVVCYHCNKPGHPPRTFIHQYYQYYHWKSDGWI